MKNQGRLRGLEASLVAAPLLFVLAAVLIAASLLVLRQSSASTRTDDARVERVLRQISEAAEKTSLDERSVPSILAAVGGIQGVSSVSLHSSDGRDIASRGTATSSASPICAPLRLTTGAATLCITIAPPAAASGLPRDIVLLAAAAIGSALLAGLYLLRRTRKPLLEFGTTLDLATGRDDYSVRLDPHRGALGTLVTASNGLLARMQERDQTLRRRTLELQLANEELEAFAWSASHDLRAPINSVDGFAQALEEECRPDLSETGRECLYWIRKSCAEMAGLIDGLLQMSRLGRAEVEREEFDASSMMQSIATTLRQRDPSREVKFQIEEGIAVDGDPHLIRAALENLASNAWKFTKNKEQAVIEFGVARRDGVDAIFIRDNGPGFAPEQAAKIFRPFQRLHSRSEYEGSGIGLATVDKIVRRHGGTIWTEAEPGQGATFFFTTGVPPRKAGGGVSK